MAGSASLVDATSYRASKDTFTVAWLLSMRMIVDLAAFGQSRFVNTTGQSGHPYSSHYADMTPLWQHIRYYSLPWTKEDVLKSTKAHLQLRPAL